MKNEVFMVRFFDELEPKERVLCLDTPDEFDFSVYDNDGEVFYYLNKNETARLLNTPNSHTFTIDGEWEVLVENQQGDK